MGFQPSLPCHRRHFPAVLGIFIQMKCGPAVIPTMVTTVTWILRRLCLPPLPLPEPAFEALRERALQCRGAEVRALKEAVPVPMEIVMAWELGVLEHENKEPLKAILCWQMAIMAYASMRFDDALHTSCPHHRKGWRS